MRSILLSLPLQLEFPDQGNTKGRSITALLTSCLTGLDWSALQIKRKIVSCHTANSKTVKQEVNSTVILFPFSSPCPDITHICFRPGWTSTARRTRRPEPSPTRPASLQPCRPSSTPWSREPSRWSCRPTWCRRYSLFPFFLSHVRSG
jgi:hypothetical protein